MTIQFTVASLSAQSAFYAECEASYILLSDEEYSRHNRPKHSWAFFSGEIFPQADGSKLVMADIYVKESVFRGKEHLIPIVVRHEAAELWAYAKPGGLSPCPSGFDEVSRVETAHGHALVEEWDYAAQSGLVQEYQQFCEEYSRTHVGRPS